MANYMCWFLHLCVGEQSLRLIDHHFIYEIGPLLTTASEGTVEHLRMIDCI